MIMTTLNKIKDCKMDKYAWKKLLKSLNKKEADDEPLSFLTIVNNIDLADALWCCHAEPQYDKEWRLLAVSFARRFERYVHKSSGEEAIKTAERFANGEATKEELADAFMESTVKLGANWNSSDAASKAAHSTADPNAAFAVCSTARFALVASSEFEIGDKWGGETVSRIFDERKWQREEFLRVCEAI